MTPPSFSLVSKEHLQLSYLCASFLFLRVLPLGPEPCWFYLHDRFLIPAILSGPTAIPFSALILSWLGCHQFQFFLRSLNCPFPNSILHLSAGCPPASPLSAQESNGPQNLHLIFAKRPRSNSAQHLKQSGHEETWECIVGRCWVSSQLLEHPRAQDTGDAPLLILPPLTLPISPPEVPLLTPHQRWLPPAQPWSHPRIIIAHPPCAR